MSQAGPPCRYPGTLVKRNKNKLCGCFIWQPSQPGLLGSKYQDTRIPGGNFPSNNARRAARRMNQARNRTAGNTLLMRIASNLYTKNSLYPAFFFFLLVLFKNIGELESEASTRERARSANKKNKERPSIFFFPTTNPLSWRSINPLRFIFYQPRSTNFEGKIAGLWTGYTKNGGLGLVLFM